MHFIRIDSLSASTPNIAHGLDTKDNFCKISLSEIKVFSDAVFAFHFFNDISIYIYISVVQKMT